jgi:small-conductance mechanosensitive channel
MDSATRIMMDIKVCVFLVASFFVLGVNADTGASPSSIVVEEAVVLTSNMAGVASSPVFEGASSFHDLFPSVEDILEQSTLAGQLTPLIGRFKLSPEQWKAIWNAMTNTAQWADICVLVALGYFMVPTISYPYSKIVHNKNNNNAKGGFRSTKGYHIMETLSQMARLGILVYLVDMIKIFLVGAGFSIPRSDHMTHAFAYILYTGWACKRLSAFKFYVLCQVTGESKGRVQVVNRLGDAFLYLLATILILDILDVKLGLALKSMAAFGSMGTLVFTLASQGIAKQLLYGIMLSASDRIYEGDSVLLGKSKLSGTVAHLGWVETVIRGSDEVMVTVSNEDLVSEKVSNLSRIRQSQVKQVLKFPFSDVEKLPALSMDIKSEIRRACPHVITDGSRPFRCFWTNIGSDHLEVTVEAYFRIQPIGDVYWENRQRVLQAIHQAVKRNNMTFKEKEEKS